MPKTASVEKKEFNSCPETLLARIKTSKPEEIKKYFSEESTNIMSILSGNTAFKNIFLSLDKEKRKVFINNLANLSFEKKDGQYAFLINNMAIICNDIGFKEINSLNEIIESVFLLQDKKEILSMITSIYETFVYRRYEPDFNSKEALNFLENQMKLLVDLKDYIAKYENKNEKIIKSLNDFYIHSIKQTFSYDILMQNAVSKDKSISKQAKQYYKELKKLAHEHFSHRHIGRRVLADILQFITGAFIVIMPMRVIAGKSALFSQGKTTRQEVIRVLSKLTNRAQNCRCWQSN